MMTDETSNTKNKLSSRDHILLAVLIGLLAFIISFYVSSLSGSDASDFKNILVPARDWLAGKDIYLPYKLNLDPLSVPYPFTAYLISVPFTWLPNRIAAGVFTAIGSGILAWLILHNKANRYCLLFLSWPFVNNLLYSQFAPYITSLFFTPNLLFLLFIKPQLALPFVAIQRPSRTGILLAGLLLIVSLVLYPMWPLDWLKNLHLQNYIGFPPLFILPLGPLILLALIRYRDKRAWLLVLLAAMPQRMVYDQLGVLLVAENLKQQIFLILCSWISLPALLYYNGWKNMPWGWQTWILIESYLPALIVVLLPTFRSISQHIKVLARGQIRA
jgi:hypothetical protein